MLNKELLNEVDNRIKSNYKSLIKFSLALISSIVVSFFLALASLMIPQGIVLFGIFMLIIIFPICFGVVKQTISIYRSETTKAFDFVKFAKQSFIDVWSVTFKLILKYSCIIICAIIAVKCIYELESIISSDSSGDTHPALLLFFPIVFLLESFLYVVVGGAALIFGSIAVIGGVRLSLKYLFVYNELVHVSNLQKSNDILETVSQNLMGYKEDVFLLEFILFILVSINIGLFKTVPIIGIIFLIVMIFFIIPYIYFIGVALYEKIREKAINDKEEKKEEINKDNEKVEI